MTTLLPCGERAFLVELASLDAVLALDGRVREAAATNPWGEHVSDIVPAARTLLVSTHTREVLAGVRTAVAAIADALTDADVAAAAHAGAAAGVEAVEIPVVYDGPDLKEVAELTGMTVDEVVTAHTGTPWRVGFGGFAPGFAYLVDGDPRLEVPRRSVPRTIVPAGAVGLAGTYSGIYPRPSPGGWQLLGHTDLPLWDVDRTPPALLQPGAWVRFVAVPPTEPEPAASEPAPLEAAPPGLAPPGLTAGEGTASGAGAGVRTLEVLRPGPLTLVQDLGRPGWKHVGVGRAGPADTAAHKMATRLVGNPIEAGTLEVTFGGLSVRALGSVCVGLTGAPAPATVNGRAQEHMTRLYLAEGDVLTLGVPKAGLRTYLAASGGILAPETLGSRSADTMARLGPDKLAAGDLVRIGPALAIPSLTGYAPVAPDLEGTVSVDVIPGPRAEWTGGLDALLGTQWEVSSQCDRVGVRLEGEPLVRAEEYAGRELPSEGVMRGAIQVPASGLPVLFLNDHPVTGGYPVIGVLTEDSSDRVAQARPGQRIRFRIATGASR